MTKIAILIAVENYSSPGIEQVRYARNDAEALSEALALHGFDKADQTLLIDGDATKGAVESKVRRAIARLRSDDVCYFYYAGHAFSKAGRNFLTCHDTQEFDWEGTSIALAALFKELQDSECKHIALFLDCGASGMRATPGMRGIYDNLQASELEGFLQHTEHCVCFAACQSDETSYPTNHHKHGVWTYHLIEALKGNAPSALRKNLLLSSSLQNYLGSEVARSLSIEHTKPIRQTPWMSGGTSGDFLVADLRPILAARKKADAPGNELVNKVSFTANESSRVKSLSGWNSSYRLPDRANDTAQSFIAGLSVTEIKDDLDSVYQSLKNSFHFTRREISASEPLDGSGTIVTPYFNYSVSVTLNPNSLSEVIWTRTVDAIKQPDQILSDAFGEVFDNVFDTLEFSLPAEVEVADLIDAVEAAKNPHLKVTYDRDCTYCDLEIAGSAEAVRMTADTLSIVHSRRRKTKALIESFNTIKKLVLAHDVPLISFARPAK
ncbi:MAG: hypothetical protein C0483_08420 [Pirellula sp.]|nr:hypothetical protein [Pirellula sp.]